MTGYCPHGLWCDACRDCDGRMLCVNTICGNLVTRMGTQCSTCDPVPSSKAPSGEARMAANINEWHRIGALPMTYTTWGKSNVDAKSAPYRQFRPDLYFDVPNEGRVVILEYDEHAHQSYVMSCELGRQGTVAVGYGTRPVHIIRYNPDNLPSDAWLKEVNRAQRERFLLVRLQAALVQASTCQLRVEYLFYPSFPSGCATAAAVGKHIDCDPRWLQRFDFHAIQPDYEAWCQRAGDKVDEARQYVQRKHSNVGSSRTTPPTPSLQPSSLPSQFVEFLSALVNDMRTAQQQTKQVEGPMLVAMYNRFTRHNTDTTLACMKKYLRTYENSIKKLSASSTYAITAGALHYQLAEEGVYVPNATLAQAEEAGDAATTLLPDTPLFACYLSALVNRAEREKKHVLDIVSTAMHAGYAAFSGNTNGRIMTIAAMGRALHGYALSIERRHTSRGTTYSLDVQRLREELIRRKAYDPDASPTTVAVRHINRAPTSAIAPAASIDANANDDDWTPLCANTLCENPTPYVGAYCALCDPTASMACS